MKRIAILYGLTLIGLFCLPEFLEYIHYIDTQDNVINFSIIGLVVFTIIGGILYKKKIRISLFYLIGFSASIFLYVSILFLYPKIGWIIEYGSDMSIKTNNPTYDLWERAKPNEVGFNEELLNHSLSSYDSLGFVKALIIIKNDKLVVEKYYNKAAPNKAYKITSASKSFTSALVGIALEKGLIDSLNQPIISFFPEYYKELNANDNRNLITVANLLTMQSGFKFTQRQSPRILKGFKWIDNIFNTVMDTIPGRFFNYGDHNTYLLSAIVQETSGISLEEFGNKYLFKQLGIEITKWVQSPEKICHGGAGIYIRPIDFAKFGYLYLKGGKINNQQYISKDWIENSTKLQINLDKGLGCINHMGYGYHWWVAEFFNYKAFMAIGSGGQLIINIPEIDMTLVQVCALSLSDEEDFRHRDITSKIICKIIEAVNE
jgi:CubicO group peptidase (beta-lactamase class C family)